jgi:hypothetical protein
LFAKLLEFFDDLLFFDTGAGEQTFKSGGCGAQGMEIGFQNWFTFGGNVKADGLAMPGYGDGISALQQRRHALTKFPYSYFGRGHICGLVCFMCTHYSTTAVVAGELLPGADPTLNRPAKVSWVSLSERNRWQRNDRIRELLCDGETPNDFLEFCQVDRTPQLWRTKGAKLR